MDQQQLEILYNKYYKEIYFFILKKTSSTELANDLIQETFLQVLTYQQNNVQNERAWLYKIAYNTINRYFNKKKRERSNEISLEEIDEFALMQSNYLGNEWQRDWKILKKEIYHFLKKEKAILAEIFILRINYQLTQDEISVVLEKSKSTVRRHLEKIATLIDRNFSSENGNLLEKL